MRCPQEFERTSDRLPTRHVATSRTGSSDGFLPRHRAEIGGGRGCCERDTGSLWYLSSSDFGHLAGCGPMFLPRARSEPGRATPFCSSRRQKDTDELRLGIRHPNAARERVESVLGAVVCPVVPLWIETDGHTVAPERDADRREDDDLIQPYKNRRASSCPAERPVRGRRESRRRDHRAAPDVHRDRIPPDGFYPRSVRRN